MTMRSHLARAGGLVVGLSLAATAAGAAEAPRAEAFEGVLKCRSISDGAARLACYDAAAGRMGDAEKKGEIVVIDRAQAAAAHREAFGLPVPSLAFINRALRAEEVDVLDGVVASAQADRDGRWTVKLQDGAVWRQISGDLTRPPKAGSKVRIRKGTIGSFLMNVDGQQAIKVHRDS